MWHLLVVLAGEVKYSKIWDVDTRHPGKHIDAEIKSDPVTMLGACNELKRDYAGANVSLTLLKF